MSKQFNYVYKTTNLVNGKEYIGEHSTDNLNDSYIGSGLLLKTAIKKYGKQNFKKEILEHFVSKEEAFNIQKNYIDKFNTLQPYGYNISPTGGMHVMGCIHHSEETRKKMSASIKGKTLGRKQPQEEIERRRQSNIGKKRTEESKLNISNSLKGIKFTEKRKQNISNVHKGKTFFAKNFGPPRFGKDNPAYVEVNSNIINQIIDVHINKHLSAKAIKKELNLLISWNKVLKILRENNSYNPNYQYVDSQIINNIIDLRINKQLSAKDIRLKLNLSINENKILNIIKENNAYKKINRYNKIK
jgi:hypothetical protein